MDADAWTPAATPPTLGPDAVHVWSAALDLDHHLLESLTPLLDPDERQRAERFHFLKDRLRYIAGRGQLRLLLGQYLGIAPEAVRLCYGPHGKPALVDE